MKNKVRHYTDKSWNEDEWLDVITKRGGKREGAGRPKSKPTKTLSYRVPLKLAAKIDKAIRKLIATTAR